MNNDVFVLIHAIHNIHTFIHAIANTKTLEAGARRRHARCDVTREGVGRVDDWTQSMASLTIHCVNDNVLVDLADNLRTRNVLLEERPVSYGHRGTRQRWPKGPDQLFHMTYVLFIGRTEPCTRVCICGLNRLSQVRM